MRYNISLFSGNLRQDCGPTRLIETGGFNADSLVFYRSRAYFCQQCGRVWCIWDKEDTGDLFGQNYFSYNRSCPDHSMGCYYGDTPGSITLYPQDVVVLPRSILEYEFLTLMERSDERASYARG